eukprot:CAMPEP_0116876144 /NCGR_PEP_ID=MMETSP0463-20121206/8161_1 /TAXON_ID=181622 /ORGANISM="Strombidinopsis sp, Strain SopsisLIS2011" /LENGTH=95 /DNA_ID=CAMNT_0004522605 /DNA_START=307 /DNA_END=594 /DNA_ORIENTATION=+
MVDALKGVNKVMTEVNANMDINGIREVLKEFSKQSEKMDMQQEMMNDQMDMAMDTGDVVAESDEVYDQILADIGMNIDHDQKVNSNTLSTGPVAQ